MKKNLFRRLSALVLSLVLVLSLTACGGGGESAEGGVTVGVIQYATHPSLDNCYTGFIKGLAEAGFVEGENLTIDLQNAQGDMANSDLQAKNMVTSQYDMLMAIATPAAMSAYSAAKDAGIPVMFTAVSDPVSCGIAASFDATGTICAGSADILDFDAQLQMIRAFLPDAKTIGIVYTTSEPNSVSQLAQFEALAPSYGFEVSSIGITAASEVATAAATLVARNVDCINNFTDNNVVNNLTSLLHVADEAGIPVFGSEVEQVKNGCLASESIDYVALGRETGALAARILKGEVSPEETAVITTSECTPVYNPSVAEKLGISLPEVYASAEAVSAE